MLDFILSKLIIKNVKTGRPSYVLTAFVVGIFVVNLKLLLAGIDFKGFKMSNFTGTDYAASIAALGGVYGWNKQINNKTPINTNTNA